MAGEQDNNVPVEIGPQEFEAMRRAGQPHVAVDVREKWELDVCAISDTLHVPLGELPNRVAELPTDKPLVVICRSGRRSMDATMFLRNQGFANATNLRGGVLLWGQEIDPTMRSY
jgi:rhodanese-related sulfurtransferase